MNAEDDGMEVMYTYVDDKGAVRYLLSNNMPVVDRNAFANLISAQTRAHWLTAGASLLCGIEFSLKNPRMRAMAVGWRFLTCTGISALTYSVLIQYSSRNYGPLIGGFLRKYSECAKTDPFEIKDRTREFFEIDDSQYMAYTFDDLKHEHMHANHGPQPDGEVADQSYYDQVNKFLNNEENQLTEHPRFLKYPQLCRQVFPNSRSC